MVGLALAKFTVLNSVIRSRTALGRRERKNKKTGALKPHWSLTT
jgi:hypothetical protein